MKFKDEFLDEDSFATYWELCQNGKVPLVNFWTYEKPNLFRDHYVWLIERNENRKPTGRVISAGPRKIEQYNEHGLTRARIHVDLLHACTPDGCSEPHCATQEKAKKVMGLQ